MYSCIVWGNILAVSVVLVFYVLQFFKTKKPEPEPLRFQIGDITAETLQYFCGYDFMKPILVAVRLERPLLHVHIKDQASVLIMMHKL
jgi:hypothetical protein